MPAVGALPAAVLLVALAVAACGGGAPTAAPATSSSDVPTALEVTAENIAFSPTALVAPADVPFTITLHNRDDGIPHNIAIRAGAPAGDVAPSGRDLFVGEIVRGPVTTTYDVPALPAGQYTFYCQVHPNMIGTLTLR